MPARTHTEGIAAKGQRDRIAWHFPKDELYSLWLVGDARGSLLELERRIESAVDCLSEAAELAVQPSEMAPGRNRLRHGSESQAAAPDSRLLP